MFQFYLSSIKSIRQITIFQREPCFNSTLVQLKGLEFPFGFIVLALFQFYLSSIKRIWKKIFEALFFSFQFYLSSIKSVTSDIPWVLLSQFQFYLSSIKSLQRDMQELFAKRFQFYLSSIKSWTCRLLFVQRKGVSILP